MNTLPQSFPLIDESLLPPVRVEAGVLPHNEHFFAPSLLASGVDVTKIGQVPPEFQGRSYHTEHRSNLSNLLPTPSTLSFEPSELSGYYSFYLLALEDIKAWLQAYDIDDYHLELTDKGWVVDIEQSVVLTGRNLFFVPIMFRRVRGDFLINHNFIQNLSFGPSEVGGHYNASHNRLKDLKGVAHTVQGTLNCSFNPLQSLEGLPENCSHIGAISLRQVPLFSKYLHTTNPQTIAYDLYSEKIIEQKTRLDTEVKQLLMAKAIENNLSIEKSKLIKI